MAKADDALVVRLMATDDLPRVVAIHRAAFEGFFLTSLGPRFLALFYAETVRLAEPALVATRGGRVVGFVTGSVDPGRFFGALLRQRGFRFALAALPAVLARPRTAARVARAILKPREAARPAGTATLMSLGVEPGARGAGAGRRLVEAFVAEVAARGASRVDLTTDRERNDRVNAFYRRLGFVVAREIVTPEGRVLNEYARPVAAGERARPREAAPLRPTARVRARPAPRARRPPRPPPHPAR